LFINHFHFLQAPLAVDFVKGTPVQGKLLDQGAVSVVGLGFEDAAVVFIDIGPDASDDGVGSCEAGTVKHKARLAEAHFAFALFLGGPVEKIKAEIGE